MSRAPGCPIVLCLTLLVAGCAGSDAPPGPADEWDRQVAAVRAGESDAIVIRDGSIAPSRLLDLREGCGGLRRLSLIRAATGPPICPAADYDAELTAALRSLPDLTRLDFDGPIGPGGTVLSGPTLTHLNLPNARADGKDVARLTKDQPALTLLRLRAPRLDDEAAPQFAEFRALRFLHLIDAPLTDAAVPALASCARLESLYLDGARLTDGGWEELHRLRPDLHLHADLTHPVGGH